LGDETLRIATALVARRSGVGIRSQHHPSIRSCGKKFGTEDTKQQVATEIAKAVKDAQTESAEKQAEHDKAFKDYMAQAQTSMQLASRWPRNAQKWLRSVAGMSPSEVEAAIARALNKPRDSLRLLRIVGNSHASYKLDLMRAASPADTVTIEKGKQAIAEKEKSGIRLQG
jgi:hypothetical protein